MRLLNHLKSLTQRKLIKENMMNVFTLNLIKNYEALGQSFYSGSILLKDLFSNYKVPHYQPGQGLDVGYQRQAKFNRIKNISKRVSDENSITESFLDCVHLNLRSEGASNFVRPIDDNNLGSFFTFDYTNDFGKFYVVDGQTRIRGAELAYEKAIEENDYNLAESIENIRVPFSLSFIQNPTTEAFIFHILNFHSAPLPTNGGYALMKHGFEEGSDLFQKEIKLLSKTKDIYALQIAERLNTDHSVLAGEMKDYNGHNPRKISLLTFSKLILPILNKYLRRSDDVIAVKDATYNVIGAYWDAIKSLYPMMFAPKTKSQFHILSASASEIMMKVLSAYLNDQFQNENSADLTDPETYKKFLVNLRNVKDVNKSNNKVMGQDIFRYGADGAIGKYSSGEGRKYMARQIYLTLFPKKEIVF